LLDADDVPYNGGGDGMLMTSRLGIQHAVTTTQQQQQQQKQQRQKQPQSTTTNGQSKRTSVDNYDNIATTTTPVSATAAVHSCVDLEYR